MSDVEGAKDSGLVQANLGRGPVLWCIPADTTNQMGYTTPLLDESGNPLNGGKGTPATTITRNKAGVFGALKYNSQTEQVTPSTTLSRAKDVQPTALNYPTLSETAEVTYNSYKAQPYAPWRYSGYDDLGREWVSQDRKLCVTVSTGTVRVNGVDKGTPGPLVWACVMKKTVGQGTQDFLLAVTESGGDASTTLQFWTKPKSAGQSEAWTAGPSVAMNTLLGTNNANWQKAQLFVRRGSRNATGDKCLVWVQNPWPYNNIDLGGGFEFQGFPGRLPEPNTTKGSNTAWAWVLEFDINAGTFSTTVAEVEALALTATGLSPTVYTANISGKRQIDCAYEGDTKVYTELELTTMTFSDFTADTQPTSPYNITVTLKRGDWSIPWISQTTAAGTHVHHAMLHCAGNVFVVWKQEQDWNGSSVTAYRTGLSAFINGTEVVLKPMEVVPNGVAPHADGFLMLEYEDTSYTGRGNGWYGVSILNSLSQAPFSRVFQHGVNDLTTVSENNAGRRYRFLPNTVGSVNSGVGSDSWLNFRILDNFYVFSFGDITWEASLYSDIPVSNRSAWARGSKIKASTTQYTTICSHSSWLTGFDTPAPSGLLKDLRLL